MALPKPGTPIRFEDVHPEDISVRRPRVIERNGIVWSPADAAMSVWVIPDDDPDRHAVKVRCPGRTQRDHGQLPCRIDGAVKVPDKRDRYY
jgi:hypothetical protein